MITNNIRVYITEACNAKCPNCFNKDNRKETYMDVEHFAKLCIYLSEKILSKILCKWKRDSVISLFLYLDSVFKHKHKLIHNQAPVMNRLCPFLLNLHK